MALRITVILVIIRTVVLVIIAVILVILAVILVMRTAKRAPAGVRLLTEQYFSLRCHVGQA